MTHLLVAGAIAVAILGPLGWTIAFRWQGQITEDRKRLLDATMGAVQLVAILAGGYWFAMKYLLSERDTFGPRITVTRIEAESEIVPLGSDSKGCRVLFKWGAKNGGPAAGTIDHSYISLKKLGVVDWTSKAPQEVQLSHPEAVEDDVRELVLDKTFAGPPSPLRPGSLTEWSYTLVFPESEQRYSVEAEVYAKGDPNPWRTSATVRCVIPQTNTHSGT